MSTSLPTPSVLAKKKELNLYAKNWVRNSHLANVAAILRTNSSLTFVGFRECCGVSDMGAVAIAASLGENSTLKKLNFESTKVGNKGVSALANAIGAGTNYTLYRLDLAYCPIGDEGVCALARAIAQTSCPLQVLHLDYCPQITDIAAHAVITALSENTNNCMATIGLKGTSVSALLRAQVEALLFSKGSKRNACTKLRCSSADVQMCHQGGRPVIQALPRPPPPPTTTTTTTTTPATTAPPAAATRLVAPLPPAPVASPEEILATETPAASRLSVHSLLG
jgi:hypothetical protein